MKASQLKPVLLLLLPALAFLCWLGMQHDIMEVDAAQYASIAREMRHNNQWLQVYEHGETYQSRGYPDKPPLLFWLGAAGMSLFGENNFGYRFFAVISSLLAMWGIGRWAALLFGEHARWPARTFYSFNIGMLLMNSDLRTDTLLINLITLSAWQLELFMRKEDLRYWLSGLSLLALAMLAKGPVALVALLLAFGTDALLRRDFKRLLKPAWLAAPIVILAWLMPMLYGLYQQWGWEKGIKYYFWTQSFGRITGENVWQNDLPFSFLSETLLWTFLPWSLLLPALLYLMIKNRKAYAIPGGWVGPAGFMLMLLAMSTSKYKLPHYIYVVWPFLALSLCPFIENFNKPIWRKLFFVSGILLVLTLSVALSWVRGWETVTVIFILFTAAIGLLFLYLSTAKAYPWWVQMATTFLVSGFLLHLYLYPWLLSFQASSMAGKKIYAQGWQNNTWVFDTRNESIHALHFYSRAVLPQAAQVEQLPAKVMVYTHVNGYQTLKEADRAPQIIDSVLYYPVSILKSSFLNPVQRHSVVEKRYILQLSR
ncbi:MAG: ArnT family glycosyltransferase [Bacteroidia bacterium]